MPVNATVEFARSLRAGVRHRRRRQEARAMIRSTAARLFSAFALTVIAALWLVAWGGGAHAQATYAVLHTFGFGSNNGRNPSDGLGLIQDPDGTLYGTTYSGGSAFEGTIFQMAPD